MKLFASGSKFISLSSFLANVFLFLLLNMFTAWAFAFLAKNRLQLDNKSMKSQYENLYKSCHMTKNKMTVLQMPIFLSFRLLLVVVWTFSLLKGGF
jgi:hypothetical protein